MINLLELKPGSKKVLHAPSLNIYLIARLTKNLS